MVREEPAESGAFKRPADTQNPLKAGSHPRAFFSAFLTHFLYQTTISIVGFLAPRTA